MEDDRTSLTERITFAENWLDRARREIKEGDLDRGTLTLILAEAEVHRAREVSMTAAAPGTAVRTPPPAWRRPAALAATGFLLAVSLAAFWPKARVEAPDIALLPIVRLSAGTGAMLRLVTAPEPAVERTVEKRVILRVPVPVSVTARDDRPALPAIASPGAAARQGPVPQVAASTTVSAPAGPAAVPVVAPAPVLLNEADVIDLVLAAERSLRRSANQ